MLTTFVRKIFKKIIPLRRKRLATDFVDRSNQVSGLKYVDIYSSTFSEPKYSNEYHVQYGYVLERIKELKLNTHSIVDVGSGRGQVIGLLNNNESFFRDLKITSVDLKKFHNEDISEFLTCDLSVQEDRERLLSKKYDVAVCTDVLEHLDKAFIEDVVGLLSRLSDNVVLAIANHSDVWNGVELHTIQESDIWWDSLLKKYFKLKDKQVRYDGRLYQYLCESIRL